MARRPGHCGGNRTLSSAEEALKTDVINTLALVYERAEAVIVLDAILLRLHSMDPVDIAMALCCGKWRTRIWTYQEAKLATKVLLLTASGVADFQDVLKELAVDMNCQSLLAARVVKIYPS